MRDFIPVNKPLLDGNEKKYLLECIESGWISSEGPFVKELEQKFAARVVKKHGVAVFNGTAAIDVSVESLGIGAGDEVIMPTFTIISCINQIVRNGAVPVLVDSDPVTWNMDVAQIESRISRRTKAIMIVHIFGLPVDVDPVLDIARRYGLRVIEDAAEMHDDLAETCRSLRNLCFQPGNRFVHERLGWNFRMTNMQAALGLAQLERLDYFVGRKRAMGARYTELLKDVAALRLPAGNTDYADNIYWVYGVLLEQKSEQERRRLMQRLHEAGMETRPFFFPMHQQPVFRQRGMFQGECYPIAEGMYRTGFYLPSGLALEDEEMTYIASELKRLLA